MSPGRPVFVFLNPLSLATDDCRSVLAVKGPLRRFAPWTAAGRSGRRDCLRGKRGWMGLVRRPRAASAHVECRASSSIAGTGFDVRVTPRLSNVGCTASGVSVLLGQSLPVRPDLVLDAFAGCISSDVPDDALASLVDEGKLHKRAVSQRPDSELVFKGLGVAKRYCRRDSIGDSFLQRRPRGGHPGAPPGSDAPPPQPRPGWKAQLR